MDEKDPGLRVSRPTSTTALRTLPSTTPIGTDHVPIMFKCEIWIRMSEARLSPLLRDEPLKNRVEKLDQHDRLHERRPLQGERKARRSHRLSRGMSKPRGLTVNVGVRESSTSSSQHVDVPVRGANYNPFDASATKRVDNIDEPSMHTAFLRQQLSASESGGQTAVLTAMLTAKASKPILHLLAKRAACLGLTQAELRGSLVLRGRDRRSL
eukprot:scaffold23927_cov77-Phaeocystis_antarctica.AAC.1